MKQTKQIFWLKEEEYLIRFIDTNINKDKKSMRGTL